MAEIIVQSNGLQRGGGVDVEVATDGKRTIGAYYPIGRGAESYWRTVDLTGADEEVIRHFVQNPYEFGDEDLGEEFDAIADVAVSEK